TGTHVAHLWTASGTLLASATFTAESPTGSQQVSFSSPVAISAGTTYVVSYYAPNGGYAFNGAYFASSGFDNGPLHALSNSAGGASGVFRQAAGGGSPTSPYTSANYGVDVVYASDTLTDTAAPTVVSRTPASGATNVPTGSSVTATFSETVQASTISLVVRD